jgi:tetratricopeptide (TPR) repeat protein
LSSDRSEERAPDLESAARQAAPSGLLVEFLAEQLTQNQIPQAETPMATSEQLLRIAAGQERRYWPCFALGRTLFFRGQFSEAELAFNTCASLRPEYARSFEQRALMRALQARRTTDAEDRDTLMALALEDSDRALALAVTAGDPSTFWPRGDLLALLDRSQEAIDAYTRALESEDDIREKVNRRNNLGVVERLATAILDDPNQPTALLANAAAVVALARIVTGDSDDASEHVERALKLVPDHPHALTARGLLALNAATAVVAPGEMLPLLHQARGDFEQALLQVPENYLAAYGRAVACERLEDWPAALSAWTYLIVPRSSGSVGFTAVAATATQGRLAEEGRARAQKRIPQSAGDAAAARQ